jgi:hypothetical protein
LYEKQYLLIRNNVQYVHNVIKTVIQFYNIYKNINYYTKVFEYPDQMQIVDKYLICIRTSTRYRPERSKLIKILATKF